MLILPLYQPQPRKKRREFLIMNESMNTSGKALSLSACAERVVFVLVAPSHPGNIGGAARAMKTMAYRRLRLVNPLRFPSGQAKAMATMAADVLASATVFSSLSEALADCDFVFGTSARARHFNWPCLSPRQAAERTMELLPDRSVAFVFGSESSGLSNEELLLCHERVHIAGSDDFNSLNLAAAVQIISYELFCRSQSGMEQAQKEKKEIAEMDKPANSRQCEDFFRHLQQVLNRTGFLSRQQSQKSLMARLRLLFSRARMTRREVNILRGALSSIDRYRAKREED